MGIGRDGTYMEQDQNWNLLALRIVQSDADRVNSASHRSGDCHVLRSTDGWCLLAGANVTSGGNVPWKLARADQAV